MPATILIGAQWGDEGKGRVIDWLASQSDVVARYAGGDNAGHTVQIGDITFKLHLIPSGILHTNTTCVLGHGMVINPQRFLQEIEALAQKGIDISPQRLMISDRAHLITPGHIALDAASEMALGNEAIGTTQRGIGPAYTDKVLRKGLQAGLMHEPKGLADALYHHLQDVNRTLVERYQAQPLDVTTIAATYAAYAPRLAPYIRNITPVLHRALKENKRLLCEGAQGTLLDIDLGHYPYVTSSSPGAGGALTGLGIGPTVVDRVVGVTKAYSTRVGNGPMPTELTNETGNRLRAAGAEFGTTTGRPRRCGWLDLMVLRYAAQVNGCTELVVTKLDVLSGFDWLQVAVAYRIDGQRVDELPSRISDMARVEPIYETLPGWNEPVREARRWEALPASTRDYIQFIADFIGMPISLVSIGPEREQMIVR
jgi:adenylosuccinate synthase